MKDPTNPTYYRTENGIEAIDVIKAFTKDLYGVESFDTGNVIKYICRWKKKNGIEDLKKAKWYLDHLIKYVSACNDPGAPEYDENKEKTEDNPPFFNNVYFSHRIDAQWALNDLKNILKVNKVITVSDYYRIGIFRGGERVFHTSTIDNNKYGWHSLQSVKVVDGVHGCYILYDMGDPVKLEEEVK